MERQASDAVLPRVLIEFSALLRSRARRAQPGGNDGLSGLDHRRDAVAALHSVGILSGGAADDEAMNPMAVWLP